MKLTNAQIAAIARENGLEPALLAAVVEVEAAGSGFVDAKPKILFEPHIFYRRLGEMGYKSLREKMRQVAPHLIYPLWRTYPYGKLSAQHQRLEAAINALFLVLPSLDKNTPEDKKIIDDVRAAALESCSWGLGQVMGFHWRALGYASLQEFVNAMYTSEALQLSAMCRFMKKNGLFRPLKSYDWKGFARGYNGVGYAKNRYDVKLAAAYAKHRFSYDTA
ncbi:MAG: N-acetylmuramidase family protein [Moraxella sp.]|nr:N-acetylmuramidase family protein [Moraxella sp.]